MTLRSSFILHTFVKFFTEQYLSASVTCITIYVHKMPIDIISQIKYKSLGIMI